MLCLLLIYKLQALPPIFIGFFIQCLNITYVLIFTAKGLIEDLFIYYIELVLSDIFVGGRHWHEFVVYYLQGVAHHVIGFAQRTE